MNVATIGPARRVWRDYGLTIAFAVLFLGSLVGQALTGVAEFNNQQLTDGLQGVSLGAYLASSSFAVDVAENWQSEYLQFLLYIYLTVWLIQKGSPESKKADEVGLESDEEQKVAEHADQDSPSWARLRGFRLAVYSRSLVLVMGVIFGLSWLAQSIAGRAAFNEDQLTQLQDPVSWLGYATSADFWNRTLQNWQSEFLAITSMVLVLHLPPPTRLTPVQTSWHLAPGHRRRRLSHQAQPREQSRLRSPWPAGWLPAATGRSGAAIG